MRRRSRAPAYRAPPAIQGRGLVHQRLRSEKQRVDVRIDQQRKERRTGQDRSRSSRIHARSDRRIELYTLQHVHAGFRFLAGVRFKR